MTAERRRWSRIPLEQATDAALTADGWRRPCRIVDLGPGGAAVRLDGAPPSNYEVRIEHPTAGHLYATRVWTGPGVMGVAFDSPARAIAFLALCGARAPILHSA